MTKMIVVDLDGTLLNEKSKVSENTKDYLNTLKDKGYTIVIATGRTYASCKKATDNAMFANFLITDAGSRIYEVNGNPILENSLNRTIVEDLLKIYDDNFTYLYINNKDMCYRYTDNIKDNIDYIYYTKDKDYILSNCGNVSHISLSLINNDLVEEFYQKLVNTYENINAFIMQDSFSDEKCIVVLPENCSKYNAIRKLAECLNIENDEIMAFGDGLNDIEMLTNVGHSAALKNALPKVKQAAEDITDQDNTKDGVIDYLKDYLILEEIDNNLQKM